MTLARLLAGTPLLFATLLVAAMFAGQSVGTASVPPPTKATQDEAAEMRPPAEGSARWHIEERGCWTGDAPADVDVPGHVVATIGDDVAPTYGGPRLVGRALDQLFGGVDHGLDVHAFCR